MRHMRVCEYFCEAHVAGFLLLRYLLDSVDQDRVST